MPPAREACQQTDLQVGSNVDITAGHLSGAEEDMSAVAGGAGDLQRVRAAMGGGAVEADRASLIAVGRKGRPFSLVPSIFEVI